MSQALQEERGAALSPAVLSTAAPAVKSYQCYLVVSNPSSKNNLGNVIRCAAAFAVSELIVVGFDKWGTHGAHGSHKHVKCQCFDDWTSAAAYLRLERKCDLCGIVAANWLPSTDTRSTHDDRIVPNPVGQATASAIIPRDHHVDSDRSGAVSTPTDPHECPEGSGIERRPAMPVALGQHGNADRRSKDCERSFISASVRHRPFRRSTAFVVGHRNRLELENEALGVCDFFVHVEQSGKAPMELGAPVTTSIALHHFTAWARYDEARPPYRHLNYDSPGMFGAFYERRYTGEKFDVATDLPSCRPSEDKEKHVIAQRRVRRREERSAADPLGQAGEEIAGIEGGDIGCGVRGLGWLSQQMDDEGRSVDEDY